MPQHIKVFVIIQHFWEDFQQLNLTLHILTLHWTFQNIICLTELESLWFKVKYLFTFTVALILRNTISYFVSYSHQFLIHYQNFLPIYKSIMHFSFNCSTQETKFYLQQQIWEIHICIINIQPNPEKKEKG